MIEDGYHNVSSRLPLCGACENTADPRAWHRHPITKKGVMLCDGCVCWPPYNKPEHIEKINQSIIEMEKKRLVEEVIDEDWPAI